MHSFHLTSLYSETVGKGTICIEAGELFLHARDKFDFVLLYFPQYIAGYCHAIYDEPRARFRNPVIHTERCRFISLLTTLKFLKARIGLFTVIFGIFRPLLRSSELRFQNDQPPNDELVMSDWENLSTLSTSEFVRKLLSW